MIAAERNRQAKLERIMRTHAEYVKRTLYDLRCAGYSFTSIDEAERFLRTQRALAGLTQQQIEELALARLKETSK